MKPNKDVATEKDFSKRKLWNLALPTSDLLIKSFGFGAPKQRDKLTLSETKLGLLAFTFGRSEKMLGWEGIFLIRLDSGFCEGRRRFQGRFAPEKRVQRAHLEAGFLEQCLGRTVVVEHLSYEKGTVNTTLRQIPLTTNQPTNFSTKKVLSSWTGAKGRKSPICHCQEFIKKNFFEKQLLKILRRVTLVKNLSPFLPHLIWRDLGATHTPPRETYHRFCRCLSSIIHKWFQRPLSKSGSSGWFRVQESQDWPRDWSIRARCSLYSALGTTTATNKNDCF